MRILFIRPVRHRQQQNSNILRSIAAKQHILHKLNTGYPADCGKCASQINIRHAGTAGFV